MSDEIKIEEATSPDIKEEYKLKVVVVGDSGVGKTNLIKRFTSDTFSYDSKATVGVEFISKSYIINKKVFKIEIWDTAGQERYKAITSAYYKGAKGCLIVYDTTSQTTFHNIDKWMFEIKEKALTNIKVMIVGNKIDLKDKRIIPIEEAMKKSHDLQAPIMETSALEATNVKEAFYDLIKEMYKEIKKNLDIVEESETNEGIQLDTNEEKTKKGCC